MVLAGDIIQAAHMNRARPKRYYDEATGQLGASQSAQPIPGISIVFVTETAGAELDLVWFVRADPTGATTALISSRPLVVGPNSFSQQPTDFAIAQWAAGAANDAMTPGNAYVMTLGDAGSYTVTLLGTTGVNQQLGLYSTVKCVVQEQFE